MNEIEEFEKRCQDYLEATEEILGALRSGELASVQQWLEERAALQEELEAASEASALPGEKSRVLKPLREAAEANEAIREALTDLIETNAAELAKIGEKKKMSGAYGKSPAQGSAFLDARE